MKCKGTSAAGKNITRHAFGRVADKYYDPKYHESIIDNSRVELISHFLCLLRNHGEEVKKLSVLDVGCGKCDLLFFFGDLGVENLVGVNLFPLNSTVFRSRELVTELFGDGKGRVKYIECDVDKDQLPFSDETFDLVLFIDVLEHLYDPGFVLKEIARVTRSEGYLCMRTPNCASLKNRVQLLFGKSPYGDDLEGWLFSHRFYAPKTGEKKFQGHIREYCIEETHQLLRYFGFRSIYTKLHQAELYSQHRKLLKIYNILECLCPRFAYQLSIIAIKDSSPQIGRKMPWRHDA